MSCQRSYIVFVRSRVQISDRRPAVLIEVVVLLSPPTALPRGNHPSGTNGVGGLGGSCDREINPFLMGIEPQSSSSYTSYYTDRYLGSTSKWKLRSDVLVSPERDPVLWNKRTKAQRKVHVTLIHLVVASSSLLIYRGTRLSVFMCLFPSKCKVPPTAIPRVDFSSIVVFPSWLNPCLSCGLIQTLLSFFERVPTKSLNYLSFSFTLSVRLSSCNN